jgi:CRISPR type III-associated protein (TIGR04423 family)
MKVNSIENGIYEGYLWYSNSSEPDIVSGMVPALSDNEKFVVEGFIYDKNKGVSYSIRHDGSEILIFKYFVNSEDFISNDVVEYYGNRIEKKLRFLQYWKAEPDCLCENMEVLQPAQLVFVGFNK